MSRLPSAVLAMAARGPQWAAWVGELPATVRLWTQEWGLRPDGASTHGHCSLITPVRTAQGTPAVLKVSFPEEDSQDEHLALRRWAGAGAVRMLSADPHHRGLLLERLHPEDLTGLPDLEACRVVAGLYRRIHVPPLPKLRSLSSLTQRWTVELAALPRSAPIPRRLVEQAIGLGADLAVDRSVPDRLLHTDLHYANVLAADRENWLAIDPKPVNGDPHYEIAPLLWNRWGEIAGAARVGVRRRFQVLVDAGEFDEDRARAWVLVRMAVNAMWELQEGRPDPASLTRCVTVAKAVGD